MKTTLTIFKFLFTFLACQGFLFSQVIDGKLLDDFSICQEASYQMTIYNNENYPLEGNVMEINFPCGIEYVMNSISKADEINIENLHNPKFSVADLPVDSTIIITFHIQAPCYVLECLDNSFVFYNEFKFTHAQGSKTINSDPFNIETPQLIITKIEDPVIEGLKGANLKRRIHIRNTRLGKLSQFIYQNISDDGITLFSDNGENLSEYQNELFLRINENDFKKIGDRDEWFEFNEEIILEEKIFVETCAYDLLTAKSKINVSWGCGESKCDSTFQNAVIDINVNYEPGQIVTFTPRLGEPRCYDPGHPAQQSINIKNNSSFTAVNDLFLKVNQGVSFAVIPEETVYFVSDGDSLEIDLRFKGKANSSCNSSSGIYSGFEVIIPALLPKQSGKLIWENEFCTDQLCFSEANAWSYQYHYYKECAQPGDQYYQSDVPLEMGKNDFLIHSELIPGPLLKVGHADSIQYRIDSPILGENEGKLLVQFDLGCGLYFKRTNLEMGGSFPDSVVESQNGVNAYLDLYYDLPLKEPSQNLMTIPVFVDNSNDCFDFGYPPKDTLITSCPVDSICQMPPPTFPENPKIKVVANSSIIYEEACKQELRIISCDSEEYKLKYPTIGYLFDTVSGYLDYEFDVYRTSLGLPDNDNDNIPDEEGELDFSKIRRDRAVTGDTIQFRVKAKLFSERIATKYSKVLIEYKISLNKFRVSDNKMFISEFSNFFDQFNGFENVENQLEIIDSANNNFISINNINNDIRRLYNIEDTSLTIVYDFDLEELKSTNSNIPTDYFLSHGDSILFYSSYKVNYNLRFKRDLQNLDNSVGYFDIMIKSRVFISESDVIDPDRHFLCHCNQSKIQIAGYFITQNQFGFGIRPCYSSRTIDNYIFFGTLKNFFPFEAKSPLHLEEIRIPEIRNFHINRWRISRYNNLDLSLLEDFDLDEYIATEGISDLQYNLGYYRTMDFGFLKNEFSEQVSMTNSVIYELENCFWNQNSSFPFTFYFKTISEVEIKYISNPTFSNLSNPFPELEILNRNVNAPANNISCNLNYNIRNSVFPNNQMDIFIKPEFGKSLKFEKAFNAETGEKYDFINGIINIKYILNNNSNQTIPINVQFTNYSCVEEKIDFHYGWSCEPYINPLDTPCEEYVLECTAYSPPGIIDMLPEAKEIEAILCDTMPYSELQVFNAGLGSVYNLDLETTLPRGVTYVANSAEMAWPAELKQYFHIPDPEALGKRSFFWKLTDFMDTLSQYGLPGVNSVPNNTISIRYKTKTDCDFISGTETIYTITADKVCGEPTNSIAKVSKKMNITGVNPPYSTNINGDFMGNPGCDDEILLNVYAENLQQGDQIYIDIPEGIFTTQINCEGGSDLCPGQQEQNQLVFKVHDQLDRENLLIGLRGFSSLKCRSVLIPIYSTTKVNTLCLEKNEECEIEVVTGDKKIPFTIDRPIFSFEDFEAIPISFEQHAVDLNFTVFNSGKNHEGEISLDFYLDEDNDGEISEGDQKIDQKTVYADIMQDSSSQFTINDFKIEPDQLCKLLIFVNDEEQCLCGPSFRRVRVPVLYRKFEETYVCSREETIIGKAAKIGYRYRWQSHPGIGCVTCAETTFQISNDTYTLGQESLILEQIDTDGCILAFEYIVNVAGQVGIWAADEQICSGDVAVLFASEGKEYEWEGPGIEYPNDQVQSIQPVQSSIYRVTITDQYGCEGVDSVFLHVNPTPVANAGVDLLACFGSEPMLNAIGVDSTYSVLWSPGYPYLDDPTKNNPKILINDDRTYTLSVSKNGCEDSDKVKVEFYDGLNLGQFRDTTVCIGSEVSIDLSEGYHYQWNPFYSQMCEDEDCSQITLYPEHDETFEVYATDTGGCRDTFEIYVTVVTEFVENTRTMKICEGNEVEIFGKLESQEGKYCDTTFYGSGCFYVECIELKFESEINNIDIVTVCSNDPYYYEGEILRQSGQYCYEYISVQGCDSVYCIYLSVKESPELELSFIEVNIQEGEEARLSVNGADQYQWYPDENIDCTNCPDPVVNPNETTYYYVEGIASNGCTTIDSVLVNVQTACGSPNLLIPNAITPDGNGKNDIFRIVNILPDLQNVSIRIFNRWGEELFHGMNNEGWDGTYMGNIVPPDVYLYVVQVVCNEGESKLFKGDLTVVR